MRNIALLCILSFSFVLAQNEQIYTIRPEWSGTFLEKTPNIKDGSLLPICKDCLIDEALHLPVQTLQIPLSTHTFEVADLQVTWEESPFHIQTNYSNKTFPLPDVLVKPTAIAYEKGKPIQIFTIFLAQYRTNNQIYRVNYLQFKLQRGAPLEKKQKTLRSYASNSVLSSGRFYKLGVTDNGVYKISYNQMAQMGFDVQNLDPRNIKIYGNGGRMLPQANNATIYDDLYENTIFVQGENDGRFDPQDYVLFYGQSPHLVDWYVSGCNPKHAINLYSDSTFYFITVSNTPGKRITARPHDGSQPGTIVNTCRQLTWVEQEQTNFLLSGRLWVGDLFDFTLSRSYSFSLPNLAPNTNLDIRTRVYTRGSAQSSWTLSHGNNAIAQMLAAFVVVTSPDMTYASTSNNCSTYPAANVSNNALTLTLTHNKTLDSKGWLDFIEVEYTQQLNFFGNNYLFQFQQTNQPSTIQLEGSQNLILWDITNPLDPIQQQTNYQSNIHSFNILLNQNAFVAFDPTNVPSPVLVHAIDNQDLHALDWAQYLIITPFELRSAADQLANMHRNLFQRKVHVVNIHEVFNEFGCGRRDVTAIRNFIKMFYDRNASIPEQQLKWVLLLGDGHHDPKNRVSGVNYIPTYQSRESINPPLSYVSDDYFTFLDDDEGEWGEAPSQTHFSDIAIGRIPAESLQDAQNIVNKIMHYVQSPQTIGEWRSKVLFVGDIKLGGSTPECIHMSDADKLAQKAQSNASCYNIDKVYLDTYPAQNTPDGVKFPQAKQKFLEKLDAGSLIVNYTGHGGVDGWSNSKLYEIPDIQELKNFDRLPLYVTATCEFGRWDEYKVRCGGEQLLANPNGGAIALFTSVRVVYSSANFAINTRFYDYVFTKDTANNMTPLTIGEIYRLTKNATFPVATINTRSYSLLTDPAITLNYPQKNIVITEMNVQDTIKARQTIQFKGEVRNIDNTKDTNFQGELFLKIFDKAATLKPNNCPETYYIFKNLLFNGSVSVTNGEFTARFVMPIDINYEVGYGKIILYAQSPQLDALGCKNDVVVCCTDTTVPLDNMPPQVQLFLNDTCCWINGGLTNQNPLLIALLSDDNGINTTGLGIGRELVAILDNNTNQPIILNDYYQANKDSYNSGKLEYRLQNLEPGEHCISIKVWDLNNNSATDETCFIVENNAKLVIDRLLNYPNPFSTRTQFFFEHNKAGDELDIKIDIFTISGKLVKTLQDKIYAEGKICNRIEWDGLDEYGDKIGRGTYIYKLTVKIPRTNEVVHKYEKLVILR